MSEKKNRFKKTKPFKIKTIGWPKDSDEKFPFIAGYTSRGASYLQARRDSLKSLYFTTFNMNLCPKKKSIFNCYDEIQNRLT